MKGSITRAAHLVWSLKCMFMDVFSNTGWDIIIYGNMVSCLLLLLVGWEQQQQQQQTRPDQTESEQWLLAVIYSVRD